MPGPQHGSIYAHIEYLILVCIWDTSTCFLELGINLQFV